MSSASAATAQEAWNPLTTLPLTLIPLDANRWRSATDLLALIMVRYRWVDGLEATDFV